MKKEKNVSVIEDTLTRLFEKESNLIHSPKHYVGDYGLEVEEVLRNFIPRYKNAYLGHRVASAIEYLLRSPVKNGVEDIRKAIKVLELGLEGVDEADYVPASSKV